MLATSLTAKTVDDGAGMLTETAHDSYSYDWWCYCSCFNNPGCEKMTQTQLADVFLVN